MLEINASDECECVSISRIQFNPDNTLTITLTNGNSYTSGSLKGATGAAGAAGETSNIKLYETDTFFVPTADGTWINGSAYSYNYASSDALEAAGDELVIECVADCEGGAEWDVRTHIGAATTDNLVKNACEYWVFGLVACDQAKTITMRTSFTRTADGYMVQRTSVIEANGSYGNVTGESLVLNTGNTAVCTTGTSKDTFDFSDNSQKRVTFGVSVVTGTVTLRSMNVYNIKKQA